MISEFIPTYVDSEDTKEKPTDFTICRDKCAVVYKETTITGARECNCKDRKIIVEGDGIYIARDVECEEHGRYTSCWYCNDQFFTTEICNRGLHQRCSPKDTVSWKA